MGEYLTTKKKEICNVIHEPNIYSVGSFCNAFLMQEKNWAWKICEWVSLTLFRYRLLYWPYLTLNLWISGKVCSKPFRVCRYRRICSCEVFRLYGRCPCVLSTKPWTYHLCEDLEVCKWGYHEQSHACYFWPTNSFGGSSPSWSEDSRYFKYWTFIETV